MPKVTHVKSARKPIPRYNIEVGDSYYHWSFMVGGRGGPKICSKTPPTRSQLTNSDYLKQLYEIYDNGIPGCADADDLRQCAEELRGLGDEQEEKFNNMPDGLQQGDTGQMLEERASGCQSAADEIDNIADTLEQTLSDIEEAEGAGAPDRDFEQERADALRDAIDEAVGTEP